MKSRSWKKTGSLALVLTLCAVLLGTGTAPINAATTFSKAPVKTISPIRPNDNQDPMGWTFADFMGWVAGGAVAGSPGGVDGAVFGAIGGAVGYLCGGLARAYAAADNSAAEALNFYQTDSAGPKIGRLLKKGVD
jgi:hypothetical protein